MLAPHSAMRPVAGVPGLAGINRGQRLYVLPAGRGFTCYGFENAHKATAQAADILGRPDLAPPPRKGTVRAFKAWKRAERELCDFYRRPENRHRTHYDAGTPFEVRRALDLAMSGGLRVRIWCGDVATGRAWAEEHDVTGTIGRSMGPLRVPLLIPSARSHGRGAILTAHVVGVQEIGGGWLYRHPRFSVGRWVAEGCAVTHDGEAYANCKSEAQAERLAAFMRGERHAK